MYCFQRRNTFPLLTWRTQIILVLKNIPIISILYQKQITPNIIGIFHHHIVASTIATFKTVNGLYSSAKRIHFSTFRSSIMVARSIKVVGIIGIAFPRARIVHLSQTHSKIIRHAIQHTLFSVIRIHCPDNLTSWVVIHSYFFA